MVRSKISTFVAGQWVRDPELRLLVHDDLFALSDVTPDQKVRPGRKDRGRNEVGLLDVDAFPGEAEPVDDSAVMSRCLELERKIKEVSFIVIIFSFDVILIFDY